jgi:hypothetical protein
MKAIFLWPTVTPIHIECKRNAISNVPSRLFGSNPAWKCDTDTDLLTCLIPCFLCLIRTLGLSSA